MTLMNECYDSLVVISPFAKRGAVEMEGEGALGEGRGGVSDNDDVVICEPAVPNPTFVEDKIAATRAYEPHPARVAAGRATNAKKRQIG